MMSDLWAEEILCRVPAISLKRLRSTCKGWNSLFSDSRFTRKHLEKAAKQFLVFMLKNGRICSMSVNLQGIQSVEVTCELNLIDPRYSLGQEQLEISEVFHCDGLLLCTAVEPRDRLIVVWNPLTGQTKWIQPRNGDKTHDCYTLGSYQDKESGSKSYKILRSGWNQEFKICDINSASWRTLDVTPNCNLVYDNCGASLKGKTYWIASEEKEKQPGIFLVSFDYTRENFERLTGQIPLVLDDHQIVALSVVREEKLAVLLKPEDTSKTEIWLTNKIDETKEISWSKVLALDLSPYLQTSDNVSFLLDEEKKVLVCCDKSKVYIVGEDNRIRRVYLGERYSWPFLFNYVPSLTQI